MLLEEIRQRWEDAGVPTDQPIIRSGGSITSLDDILGADSSVVDSIAPGSVVAHVGEFTPRDIGVLLRLIDKSCIIAPLTDTTALQHESFFRILRAAWVIRDGEIIQRNVDSPDPQMMADLRSAGSPGLVLFSSGTTGEPKGALHDFSKLLDKFRLYRRPALKTLAFLLFDHIGGLNTLFHTLYNAGTIHVPISRRPTRLMKQVVEESVNLLPTTPSFLRMGLVEDAFRDMDLSQLKLVTYGTEPMDQPTLDRLNDILPDHVDIRQTYGMSELGILPIEEPEQKGALDKDRRPPYRVGDQGRDPACPLPASDVGLSER